jgi:hypothetical protein
MGANEAQGANCTTLKPCYHDHPGGGVASRPDRARGWRISGPSEDRKLAANAFCVVNHTQLSGWPPGDSPEKHQYSATAPEPEPLDYGVVPPLVLRARRMGLNV